MALHAHLDLTVTELVVGCEACGKSDTCRGDDLDVEIAAELWFTAHTAPVLLEVDFAEEWIGRWRRNG